MSRQALELALEALELDSFYGTKKQEAITAIKEALAQTQEPVATVESVATVVSESGNQEVIMSWWHEPALPVGTKLYTAPQRTWVGLTDEEIQQGESKEELGHGFIRGALWAEEKLKDKNEN